MVSDDRKAYEEFYKAFARQLKYGVYENFGANKEDLKDLLMFYSSKKKKQVTLSEYVSRMTKDQKYIYLLLLLVIMKIPKHKGFFFYA